MATASDVRHAVMHILANGPPAVFAAATATDWQKEIDRRVGACPPIPAPGDRPAWANLFKVTLGDLVAESKYAALAYANAEEVLEREAVAHEAKCVMWGPYGSMLLAAARIARGTWLITTPWLVAKLAGITGQVPVGVSFIGGICAFAALGHFRGARRVANQWKGHGRAWSSLYTEVTRVRSQWRIFAHCQELPAECQVRVADTLVVLGIAHDLLRKHSKTLAREHVAVAAAQLDGQWKTENEAASVF